MRKLHIITYATHDQGLYNELVNNKYGVEIKVLGWGDKWKGFMEKFKVCNEYVRKLDDDDIVIFLDGFDTKVNKEVNEEEIIKYIENSEHKVIFSKNIDKHMMGLEKVVFDYCIDNYIANSGMYIGYARYLNEIFDDALCMKCKDDQVNINRLCKKYSYVGIDVENKLFENLNSVKKNSNALFVQYPGTLSFKRYIRGIKEYLQFFYKYLMIINFIIIIYLLKYKNHKSIIVLITFNILLLFYMDRSCIYCNE